MLAARWRVEHHYQGLCQWHDQDSPVRKHASHVKEYSGGCGWCVAHLTRPCVLLIMNVLGVSFTHDMRAMHTCMMTVRLHSVVFVLTISRNPVHWNSANLLRAYCALSSFKMSLTWNCTCSQPASLSCHCTVEQLTHGYECSAKWLMSSVSVTRIVLQWQHGVFNSQVHALAAHDAPGNTCGCIHHDNRSDKMPSAAGMPNIRPAFGSWRV